MVNDRPPSGPPSPADPSTDAPYGQYPTYETYGGQGVQHGHAAHDAYAYGGDPLVGTTPDDYGATGSYQAVAYDPYGHTAHDTGTYDTASIWTAAEYQGSAGTPAQPQPTTGYTYDTAQWNTGQWETGQWETGQWNTASWDATGTYDTGQWNTDTSTTTSTSTGPGTGAGSDGGANEQWNTGSYPPVPYESGPGPEPERTPAATSDAHPTVAIDPMTAADAMTATAPMEAVTVMSMEATTPVAAVAPADGAVPAHAEALPAATTAEPVGARRGGGRGRRRTAKRSALLTVAVPSVAAMGVCAVAAAAVSGAVGDDKSGNDKAVQAAPGPAAVKVSAANSKLDTQLAGLSADADAFADRASRTQERIDLKARQAAERKAKAEEAARKEALRPKFLLPVKQRGLSAYYGQAGINWMSVHSGIDFPVSYGTPVMATTDGTVRTQWNPAYGNMAIVTAPDGTETWYCHLSSTKIRSGTVKAGDHIAYSGNSGNSTGPHLHFEVRPGGGSAIDPLPWLRGKGLDPT